MSNCSELLTQNTRNRVSEQYIQKLQRSGYKHEKIKYIIESELTGYEKIVKKAAGESIHRDTSSNRMNKKTSEIQEKNSWFKYKQRETRENKQETGRRK